MAKTRISEYSQTATSNLDINGVGIAGNDTARNIRPAFQQLMKALADMNAGTALDDTFALRNVTDTTKVVEISAENVPTGTIYTLDAAALFRQGACIETIHTASGTHTFNTASTYFQIEAVGGGGGGGGVDGQGAGNYAAAGGGSSGFYGRSRVLSRGAILTGTIVVGAAGAAGVGLAGGNGGDGGDTTWTDGTNSFTWGGGKGGEGRTAISTGADGYGGLRASVTGTLYGFSSIGDQGKTDRAQFFMLSGKGGSSGLGSGGCLTGPSSSAGQSGNGYGAGGSGAQAYEGATNYAGGAGSIGLLIVREW